MLPDVIQDIWNKMEILNRCWSCSIGMHYTICTWDDVKRYFSRVYLRRPIKWVVGITESMIYIFRLNLVVCRECLPISLVNLISIPVLYWDHRNEPWCIVMLRLRRERPARPPPPPPPPPAPIIVKRFGCTAIHNKALYKCIIHSCSH